MPSTGCWVLDFLGKSIPKWESCQAPWCLQVCLDRGSKLIIVARASSLWLLSDEMAGAVLPGQLAVGKAPTCRRDANKGAIRLSKNISTPTEPFSHLSQLEQLCSPTSVKWPLSKSRNNPTEVQITEFSSLSISIHFLARWKHNSASLAPHCLSSTCTVSPFASDFDHVSNFTLVCVLLWFLFVKEGILLSIGMILFC